MRALFSLRELVLYNYLYIILYQSPFYTGSGDIVGGNLKLTMGLIWTLILHYQISIGFGIHKKRRESTSTKQVLIEFVQVSEFTH